MKVTNDSGKQPTFEFTPEERWHLAQYLKSARAQGVPTSKTGWEIVHELLPHLEKQ